MKHKRIILIVLSTMVFLLLLHLNMSYQESQGILTEKIECESKGGVIKIFGEPRKHVCALLTTDSGKLCTDSSQCEGFCTPSQYSGVQSDESVGVCSDTERFSSCTVELLNGTKIGHRIACE